jgi:hypothetical protein
MNSPVVLYLDDGSIFKANSFKSKRHFSTQFFLITKVNKTKNCITLMLLRPCSVCDEETVFRPIDEFITIDLSYFCGYQSIPNVCIRECNHPPIQIKDCICGLFTIFPQNNETVLWQSNVEAEQYFTIHLWIKEGEKENLKLRVYYNNSKEYKTYQLIDQKSYYFSVTDCSLIKVLRAPTTTKVKGLFIIEWKSMIDN